MKAARRTEMSPWWRKSASQLFFLVDECLRKAVATSSSSANNFIPAEEYSPRIGSIQWLAMSSKVSVSSPQEKKKVWVEGHHLLSTSRSDLVSLNMSQILEIRMDQRILAFRRLSQNLESRISRSTQWDQSLDAAQGNSKLMGTSWMSPFWISKWEISSRHDDMNPRNGIPWTHNQFENSPKKAKIKSMDGESRPVENPFQEPRLY